MKEYVISTIVPVYNGAKYLKKCLDSLVNQTIFENIQVIVIDDGSTDDTLSILKVYEEKYENIVVVSVSNGGVSNARNIGIERATGKYITFVDADDWVDSECYEKMYKKAYASMADIVVAGFFVSNDKEDVLKNSVTNKEKQETQKDAVYDFLRGKIDVHCCNKIFKKELIKRFRFDTDLKIAEDRSFLFEILSAAKSVYLVPDVFYHYYQNENSVMHSVSGYLNMDGIKVSRKILKKTEILFPQLEPYAKAMYISMACRVYCELQENNQKDSNEYKRIEHDIKKYTLLEGIHYMSVKHFAALSLSKVSPQIFNRLRRVTFIRFMK